MRGSRNARSVDALCALQAESIGADPSLVAAAERALQRLEGRSASVDSWRRLLAAGPDAVIGVLTSTSPATRALKADSPFALILDVAPDVRARLLEDAGAA